MLRRYVSESLFGEDRSLGQKVLRTALLPASAIVSAASRCRASLYAKGVLVSHRLPVPVVAVGNLTLGGTGKTPFVLWLAERLASSGRRPAIVTRGYGARGPRAVRRVVPGDLREADEPLLLAKRLPRVPVIAGRDRRAGAALAMAEGADLILLDDAFQHLALARDLDVLLLDARCPYPEGRVIPAGPLREPWTAARRADLFVAFDSPSLASPNGEPVIHAVRQPTALTVGEGISLPPGALGGRRILPFAAIGSFERFRATLESLGGLVAGDARYPDHHRFSSGELSSVLERAERVRADLVVTTEKDAMRLPAAFLRRPDVAVLAIEAAIVEGLERIEEALERVLGAKP